MASDTESVRTRTPSIARTVATYFVVAGLLTLGALALGVQFFATQYNDLAVAGALSGAAEDIAESLDVTEHDVTLNLSEIEVWGYDALFGNLGYRVLDARNSELLLSNAGDKAQSLISRFPTDIPDGSSANIVGDASAYRMRASLKGRELIIDVVRSDRLGELAGEAVVPAVTESAVAAILLAAILFLGSLVFASRRISVYVGDMAGDLAKAGRSGGDVAMDAAAVPAEMKPLAEAFRSAVEDVLASHEAEKRFTENAAHELKTPLTIARLSIERAKGLEQTEKEELLEQIDATATMIERLLELARAQQNASFRHQQVDMVEVASTVKTLMQPLAERAQVTIEVCEKDGGLQIESDRTAWIVAIKNLVDNALNHAVGVSFVRVTAFSDQITVENDGSSISPDDKMHIFERFFRGGESTADGGGGLGLSIVRQIAEAAGASIEHADRNPTGSIFRIQFKTA